MQRTWELAMTGQYRNSGEVLARLAYEKFEHFEFWRDAKHLHCKIDEVCETSVNALARRSFARRVVADGSDSAAIWQTIATEVAAFWMRDFETFATCFVQSPHFRFHANVRLHGLTVREGWDAFARSVRKDIAMDPDPNPYLAYGMTFEDRNLTVLGDMAWCTFAAVCQTNDLHGFHGPGTTQDMRVLERHGRQWRTAFYGFNGTDFGQTEAPLWEIDRKGKVIRQNPAANQYLTKADDMMVRAGRLRLRDATADQKLTEAITKFSDIEYGIISYRSAVPIVVDVGYDVPRTIWWVIAEDGQLMVSYNDHPQLLARLDTAAKAFALSPAQSRLAAALVEGLPLNDAAQRENVSLSTAKTQLQRIFDKVGVRNQPALVRELLAVSERG